MGLSFFIMINSLLLQLFDGSSQPAISVLDTTVLVGTPADGTNFDFNSTHIQASNRFSQEPLVLTPSKAFDFTPAAAVLVDKPVLATQGDVVYSQPQASRSMGVAAEPVGHATAGATAENSSAMAINFCGDSHADSALDASRQAGPEMSAGCWPWPPCEVKRKV